MPYASGKYAIALCDRCGMQFKLRELRKLTINGKLVNLKVCNSCWEKDHPQYQLGKFPIFDPQALYQPRPDTNRLESIGLTGWNPVFVPNSAMRLGKVIV